MPLFFNAVHSGLSRLRRFVTGVSAGIHHALGKGEIEKYLLDQIRGRFEAPGGHPNAQTDPEGRQWTPISEYTLRRRKRNRNAAQALLDTGELQSAIIVTRRNVLASALRGDLGGGFVIGVNPSSKARTYASLMQFGGRTRFGYVPPRPYMGVGPKEAEHIGEHVRVVIERSLRIS